MYQKRVSLDERAPLAVASIAINSIFVVLGALALCIRLISRRIQGLQLSFNDYAALLAWPLVAAILATDFIIAFLGGAGQHLADVGPAAIIVIWKAIPILTCVWAAANTLVKLSILHFYLTIFRLTKIFRYATYAVMALVLSFGVGLILQAFLICRPFAKNWDPLLPGACGINTNTFLGDGIVNIVIDLTIVILPMPTVWRLQMAQPRKIALTIMFALGFLVCVISSVRIVIAVQFNMDDLTYEIAKASIVTTLEPSMGLIIACMPMFPPTFKRLFRGKQQNSDSWTYISSTVGRLRAKDSKKPAFHKLDDLYPLTDLEGLRTQNDITSPGGKPDSLDDDQNMNAKLEMYPQSTIKVKKGWEVRSDEA